MITKISRVLELIKEIVVAPIRMLLIYLPGKSGILLRRFYYSGKFKECGKNLNIGIGVFIENPGIVSCSDHVEIGAYTVIDGVDKISGDIRIKGTRASAGLFLGESVKIGRFNYIAAHSGVEVKSGVQTGDWTRIYSLTNLAYDPNNKSKITSIMPYSQALFLAGKVLIEPGVVLFDRTTVMPGAVIKEGNQSRISEVVL